MANEEHLRRLKEGIDVWNQWRTDHEDESIDLVFADLTGVNLSGANLRRAHLTGADLRDANLSLALLTGAELVAAELMAYVMAGMSNYEALKTATVNPAQALGFAGGTIEAGKLADLVLVDGDPLANIANAFKVKRVIANGRLYELHELINGPAPVPAAAPAGH